MNWHWRQHLKKEEGNLEAAVEVDRTDEVMKHPFVASLINKDLPQIEKLYEGLKEKREQEFDFTPGL